MDKVSNVIFFNFYNNGDIHISRNYIKIMMERLKGKVEGQFYETHKNNPYILSDIEGLSHLPIQVLSQNPVPYNVPYYLDSSRNLFINTWAGQDHCRKNPKEKKCTFPFITDNYNMILEDLGLDTIDVNIVDIFPSLDYNKFKIHNIDSHFVGTDRHHVLVCNGDTMSGQCENFDFNPIIERLSDKHKDIDFVMTNHSDKKIERENVVYSEDIIMSDSCDLNETAYLSTFCGVIVGRISGPHTFSFVKENYTNGKKINISICNDYEEADYDAKIYEECKMKTIWSEYKSEDQIENLIDMALSEAFSKKVSV